MSPQYNESIELRPQPQVAPSISVTDTDMSDRSHGSTPSPAPSRLSTSSASTPSRELPSPETPASSLSEEVTEQVLRRAQSDNQTSVAPSVTDQSDQPPSPPGSPNPASTWSSGISWRSLVPNNNLMQNIMGIGVCALTVVTVVYSHRADLNQRWENALDFWQTCKALNFSTKRCDNFKDLDITEPPFDSWKLLHPEKDTPSGLIGNHPPRLGKRSEGATQGAHLSGPWSVDLIKHAITCLVIALTLLYAVMHRHIQERRRTQVRLSDQDMARQDLSGTVKRLRGFVTAETAIKRMVSLNQGSDDDLRRRRSNPWSKRLSNLMTSDPSFFGDAIVYEVDDEGEDTESSIWTMIQEHSDSSSELSSSAYSLYMPRVSVARSLSLLPGISDRAKQEEKLQQLSRVERWFMPKRIQISDQPLPELHCGDFKGAVAFMGALTAATGGGSAMSRYPVEVPVTSHKHHRLPDSWMPVTPQDATNSGT